MIDTAHIAGQPVPGSMLAPLNEIADWRSARAQLPQRLAQDGYVLLRNALDHDLVRQARRKVLEQMAAVGEIAEPVDAAVASGSSRRAEMFSDLGVFWRSVCEAPQIRALTHGARLSEISATLLGKPTVPFDFLWLRTMLEGRATPLHFDHVYMNRGSWNVLTAWVPLGDVPMQAGPLVVVEGSNRFEDVIALYRGVDVDRDGLPGSFPGDAVGFARERGARLLTANFQLGDVILFDMFTLHGSCDNRMGGGRVRLSCDVRWQPADEARDDRWFGAPPLGHGNQSYGGLNGAKPLGAQVFNR